MGNEIHSFSNFQRLLGSASRKTIKNILERPHLDEAVACTPKALEVAATGHHSSTRLVLFTTIKVVLEGSLSL